MSTADKIENKEAEAITGYAMLQGKDRDTLNMLRSDPQIANRVTAQSAYEAFCKALNDGQWVPWEHVPQRMQEAWHAVVEHVRSAREQAKAKG